MKSRQYFVSGETGAPGEGGGGRGSKGHPGSGTANFVSLRCFHYIYNEDTFPLEKRYTLVSFGRLRERIVLVKEVFSEARLQSFFPLTTYRRQQEDFVA